MDKQRTFFDDEHESDLHDKHSPQDPNVIDEDVPRLTGQNAAILDRLRRGPATNSELARISLKYTSRISDLRSHGHRIQCSRVAGGKNVYVLLK